MKKSKMQHNEAHQAHTKYGMGDYYGTAIRNPVGRVREDYLNNPVKGKLGKLGKPPKSLA
jgi:hypothetical protein